MSAEAIVETYDWVQLLVLGEVGSRERGAPIVRAIHAGVEALGSEADVIVNVDADVTIEGDYFERLLEAFEREPSRSARERKRMGGSRATSGASVSSRAEQCGARRGRHRRTCLTSVLPLEERHGWDGIDQLKARARGWETKTLTDLPFRHHRTEGSEDGSSWAYWLANGDTAHFMGYRPWYLLARTLHRARRDPAAIGLIAGYAAAAARRSPRLDDPRARAVLRDDQSLRQDPSPST